MLFSNTLKHSGEHTLILPGVLGELEGVLTVPEQMNSSYVAFLGHPHSLQGGTMNNKVVTTMARSFKELGVASLRFNFRGVGNSFGVYDNGMGESQDMIGLANQWRLEGLDAQFIFAGFSFGSYVAYRAAAQWTNSLLITIAPPVHHYNYQEFNPAPDPWLIIMGDTDEVVPFSEVSAFAHNSNPPIPLIEFAQTGHFFHGKLIELKEQLIQYLLTKVR